MLTADLLIPPTLWVTLAVAGTVALVVYGWRRPSGVPRGRWAAIMTFMAIAFALVLVILLNPLWADPVPPPPGKPLITILVDTSASMATPDGSAGTTKTRYAVAVEAAKVIEHDAGDGFEVRVRAFDEKVTPATIAELTARKPVGESTDLASAVLASIEPDRPQGQTLVLLTDAIQTAGGGVASLREASRFAKAAGVPLYGRPLGAQAGGVDVAIESRSPRELAYISQKVNLTADVHAHGYTGLVTVHLLAGGKEIEKKDVQVVADTPALVRFEVSQAAVGLYPYELKVDAVPGELTEANNAALALLRIVDKPLCVTLVEGKPYWDSKFLMRQLATDASIEMHSLVQVAPGRVMSRVVKRADAATGATQPAAPLQDTWQVNKNPAAILAEPKSLSGVQVLILGRDTEEFLTDAALANIQRWISREGGALVCYRGSPVAKVDQALSRLLPVKWQPVRETRFQLKLTDIGRDLNWFGDGQFNLAALPTFATASLVQQTKPLATVVAKANWREGDDSPVVTYQPYGAGRVVVIEGAGMWRWAFPPPGSQAQAQEEIYGTVWHAMFRWLISDAGLVPGEMAAIRPDKTSFGAHEAAAATVLTRVEDSAKTETQPKPLTLELRLAGSTATPRQIPCEAAGDDPGTYRATFGVLPAGRYEAALSSDHAVTALFDVRQFGEEELNLAARPDVLDRMAVDSGGALVGEQDLSKFIPQFKEHLAKTRPPRIAYTTAWDRWWLFVGVLCCWATAWALRRSSGLV